MTATTMMSMIEEAWNSLRAGQIRPAHVAASTDYPIQLYAQIDTTDRPGLLAIADAEPDRLPAYASFEVTLGLRTDGRWALSLALTQTALRSQFAAMCDKILEQGARQAPSTDAGAFLVKQVARWHRMLAVGSDGLLTSQEQRGLFGELVVLEAAMLPIGEDVSVQAWVGPDDAPQDFAFAFSFVEVKTVIAGTPTIKISSLDQLDITNGALSLAVVEIVECAKSTGGLSLQGLVAKLKKRLEGNVSARTRMDDQLAKAGYADREEYGEVEYRVLRTRWFKVEAGFPRLCRSELPLPIVDGTYRILLSAIASYESDAFGNYGKP
jgi:hypothetical protein